MLAQAFVFAGWDLALYQIAAIVIAVAGFWRLAVRAAEWTLRLPLPSGAERR